MISNLRKTFRTGHAASSELTVLKSNVMIKGINQLIKAIKCFGGLNLVYIEPLALSCANGFIAHCEGFNPISVYFDYNNRQLALSDSTEGLWQIVYDSKGIPIELFDYNLVKCTQ